MAAECWIVPLWNDDTPQTGLYFAIAGNSDFDTAATNAGLPNVNATASTGTISLNRLHTGHMVNGRVFIPYHATETAFADPSGRKASALPNPAGILTLTITVRIGMTTVIPTPAGGNPTTVPPAGGSTDPRTDYGRHP